MSQQIYTSRPKINSSNLELTNCCFYYCKAQNAEFNDLEGGALLLRGVVVSAKTCIFRQNYAYQNGGAVRISSSALATFEDCQFLENNVTCFGAALSMFNVFKAAVRSCLFARNNAGKEVAAMAVSICGNLGIRNTDFIGNTAHHNGTLFVEDVDMKAKNVVFAKNTAATSTSIRSAGKCNIEMKNVTVAEAKTPTLFFTVDDRVTIKKSKFASTESNEITKNGCDIDVEDCAFNSAIDYTIPSLAPIDLEAKKASTATAKPDPENINIPAVVEEMNTPVMNTFVPKLKTDKSTIMITAYGVVIFLLILGLRMYFKNTSGGTDAQKDNSLFVEEDFDPRAQTAFVMEAMNNTGEDEDGMVAMNVRAEQAKAQLPDLDYEAAPERDAKKSVNKV